MVRIEDTIFSLDILEKKFRCELTECKGNCCRYGDSGAPLSQEEVLILARIWPVIKEYMRPEGIAVIEEKGTSVRDFDNEYVTPLINNEECAYTIMAGDIFLCAIEKAWSEGKIPFRKPLSCHLFPVRMKKFSDFRAANYQELEICAPARRSGEKNGIFVYTFLEEPLRRALGDAVYDDLCLAASELRAQKLKKGKQI